MTTGDFKVLVQELVHAYSTGTAIAVPPSSRGGAFDMSVAYAVEAELARLRRASGRKTIGRKVGFANKAMWRVLNLETLVWAHMYDDTVKHSPENAATFSLAGRY